MSNKPQEFKNDHDALVTIIAEVRQIRIDIRDLRDGMSDTIKDHERRINTLEDKAEATNIYYKVLILIGSLAVGLLIYHLTGYKI